MEKSPTHQSSNSDILNPKPITESGGFKAPELPSGSKTNSDKSTPTPTPPKARTAPTFSYREPVWTSVCEEESYKLEVLKSGKIIGKIDHYLVVS